MKGLGRTDKGRPIPVGYRTLSLNLPHLGSHKERRDETLFSFVTDTEKHQDRGRTFGVGNTRLRVVRWRRYDGRWKPKRLQDRGCYIGTKGVTIVGKGQESGVPTVIEQYQQRKSHRSIREEKSRRLWRHWVIKGYNLKKLTWWIVPKTREITWNYYN